jgi:CDGSH-type Zn-finger protein
MARIVMRTAVGPHKVLVGSETKFICGCGLSKNQPFCDGTHKATAQTEEPGRVYWYDQEGQRHECLESFPGIRSA